MVSYSVCLCVSVFLSVIVATICRIVLIKHLLWVYPLCGVCTFLFNFLQGLFMIVSPLFSILIGRLCVSRVCIYVLCDVSMRVCMNVFVNVTVAIVSLWHSSNMQAKKSTIITTTTTQKSTICLWEWENRKGAQYINKRHIGCCCCWTRSELNKKKLEEWMHGWMDRRKEVQM